jgi:hypothetical protein
MRRLTRGRHGLNHDPELNEYDRAWQDLLYQRGIEQPEDICDKCQGLGVRSYPSTATWRGGVGGQAFTDDICDVCWGSGHATERWLNLRKMVEENEQFIAARAVDALTQSCGATLQTAKDSVVEIIAVLDKLANGRKTSFWTAPLAHSLANTLRRAIGEPAKKL